MYFEHQSMKKFHDTFCYGTNLWLRTVDIWLVYQHELENFMLLLERRILPPLAGNCSYLRPLPQMNRKYKVSSPDLFQSHKSILPHLEIHDCTVCIGYRVTGYKNISATVILVRNIKCKTYFIQYKYHYNQYYRM